MGPGEGGAAIRLASLPIRDLPSPTSKIWPHPRGAAGKREGAMWKAVAAFAVAMLIATPAQVARAEPPKIRVSWVAIVTNMPSILTLKPGLMANNGKRYEFE